MATFEGNLAPSARGWRPVIGAVPFSFLVAGFILTTANHSFWQKTATYFSGTVQPTAVFGIGLAALLVAVCIALSMRFVTKPLFIFLVLTSAGASWFMDRFGVVISVDMIRNAAETTQAEAGNLITPAFVWHLFLYGVAPSLLILWVKVEHLPFRAKARRNLMFVVPLLLVATIAALTQMKVIISTSREHRDWLTSLNPVGPIVSGVRYVSRTSGEENIVVQPLGRDARVVAPPGGKPRVLVVVAGETARAQNFSLGGYGRPTNPELEARNVVYFPFATSCGTATAVSLPCMFSVYTRETYTHRKGLETENPMDVLSHAGIDAEWWDNNTGSKGIADRVTYHFMPDSADPRFCADGECTDAILLDRLGRWLDGVKRDSVLVIHQLGSHGPAYFERYPDTYRRFTPDCRTAELGDCTQDEIVNAYDNSIAFTDHVLATIIDELKRRDASIDGSMLYMSDHGESLGESGLYLHGAPYVIAPDVQTHIPFLLWLGEEDRAAVDLACLTERANEPASHDNLFHTVLGMMSVRTSVYAPALDVTSRCRSTSST
ncbi:lipid A ethanolaminephosphotransferase [Rhizobium subbaraonis]|uniref:Lipid A ethanolaminephosphotransferase n=1 Tax=Rhizobium subbaraonis TaxID=908946 RepID=A0A285UB52_9HYPH|nr:phosphoethanolamine--lipid A transferase [Rhizobium subbaraonis]SOC37551.1 lipid A ethanolaminephosphotransferase [Rhizobium subbaraonis]